MTVEIGAGLSLADVVAVADGAPVAFPELARASVAAARAVVERAVSSGDVIYGVTTGFGALADTRIDATQAAELQHGIIRSHATAVGEPLSREEARAMLLLRAHVLALGHSGVRAEVIDLMVRMLNEDVIPAVPQQGSLGASGDLAPLANLALPLIGHGSVLSPEGGVEPAAPAFARAGLAPLSLEAEGRAGAGQRHAGHARDRHPHVPPCRAARPDRGRRGGHDDRGRARHRRAVRRTAPAAATPPGAERERGQPAPVAGGFADPGLPS